METLSGGYTLDTGENAFPLSTDSMVLADFVKLPRNATVLDLGSGCGTLGLLLCARDAGCSVTGVEIDPSAHETALENIRANHLSSRLSSICTDLRTLSPGSYHIVLSNPPYYSGGPASREHPAARRDDTCTLEDLFAAAARSLRTGGDFFLVHKPERLAQLCACGENHQLEPKRLKLVRHQKNGPVTLILLACRKGGKPGLIIEDMYLFAEDGTPSSDYRRIYHI